MTCLPFHSLTDEELKVEVNDIDITRCHDQMLCNDIIDEMSILYI